MMYNQEDINNLLQLIEGVVWEADIDSGQFTFISKQIQSVLGFRPQHFLGRTNFWEACILKADKQVIDGYKQLLKGQQKTQSFLYRLISDDGRIVWIRDNVSVIYNNNRPVMLRGIMLDVTITERLLELERLEGHVLRLNSNLATPLTEVLNSYMSGLEALFPNMSACIHRVKNNRLDRGISPSLPGAYLNSLAGMVIGINEGSCGAAAALKKRVIVSDIASDLKWEKWKHIALGYQLRACWSNPVIDSEGEVMATVSMYYNECKLPGEDELKVMERATALLRIILENRQNTEIIREKNLLMLQSQELAHFGNWRWDVQADVVSWSPALYTIYGLNPDEFKATFAGYQERLHPEDKARVYQAIEKVLKTGQDAEFEERIIRPNGELRHLRSWAKLKTDQFGHPLEMIGACLDITEKVNHRQTIEQRNRQLTEIAWVQSHLIRSPLAKIMGLIDIIKDGSADETEKQQLLDYLQSSALELDEQIKRIGKDIESG